MKPNKVSRTSALISSTFATMSTGVNIPNIRHVVFGCPSKSSITVLQSIGRGLRLHTDKTHMVLWDIIDDLRYKKSENYAYQHAIERLSIYQKERFSMNIKEMDI
jgi:superfamily II DNA or RNA helicase